MNQLIKFLIWLIEFSNFLRWLIIGGNKPDSKIIRPFDIKRISSLFKKSNHSYWNENINLIIRCLVMWFIVSYGFGILFVEYLNFIRLGGFKLGFWFAQQGSIYIFVFLIFYYAHKIGEIDKKYGVDI